MRSAGQRASPTCLDWFVAGRLVPHKRVGLMLDVLARLPGVTAAVVGDGPERPKLERAPSSSASRTT